MDDHSRTTGFVIVGGWLFIVLLQSLAFSEEQQNRDLAARAYQNRLPGECTL